MPVSASRDQDELILGYNYITSLDIKVICQFFN